MYLIFPIGKIQLVKEIIVNLAHDLEKAAEAGERVLHEWQSIPVERFLANENVSITVSLV